MLPDADTPLNITCLGEQGMRKGRRGLCLVKASGGSNTAWVSRAVSCTVATLGLIWASQEPLGSLMLDITPCLLS